MAEIAGCHGCANAQWDADGCTCRIDGLLVGNPAKGCAYCIYDEKPETVSEDYERGFKDGLKSECLKELKPIMVKLAEGCTEAIKGITPMLIDNAQLTIKHAVNRWIPCSERLPDVDVNVLIYYPKWQDAPVQTAHIMSDGICWEFSDGEFYPSMREITHWIPLPEPPESEVQAMNSAADWYADTEQRERVEKSKRISNADRIRQMTDEELADFLDIITDCCHGKILSNCDRCPMKYADESPFCRIDEWLKQEVKE